MTRYIGIRHRVKRTAEDEARPTQVCILENGKARRLDLADEQAELDFVTGQLPIEWRSATPEDITPELLLRRDQCKSRPHKNGEEVPPELLFEEDKKLRVITKVPSAFDGLRTDDVVLVCLGGSGDFLSYALSRRAEDVGASAFGIPSFVLKVKRAADAGKDDDALLLATLAAQGIAEARPIVCRDRDMIALRGAYERWVEAMKERIACEQRLRQRLVGMVFCTAEGKYPQGTIDKQFDKLKANDRVLLALCAEEGDRLKEMTRLLESSMVYRKVFVPINGIGPRLAARIMTAVGDIRRFPNEAKFKAYIGAHVLPDGTFPRRKRGKLANWSGDGRQSLYLFIADQCVKRSGSEWGQRLLHYKAKFRELHPEPVTVDGKTRYNNGHIHQMAVWRTITKFAEWLYREWSRCENGK